MILYKINFYCSTLTFTVVFVSWFILFFYFYYYYYFFPVFVFFGHILQHRVAIWLFCIFFFMGYTLWPPLRCWGLCCFHMIFFNYGAKGKRDAGPACRCHQSNIMPDSIFSVNIALCVTCLFVFCFAFFMCVLRGDILAPFIQRDRMHSFISITLMGFEKP